MRIGVVGAGVIGTTIAHALARDGHHVTVLERSGIAAGASGANAGAFAFTDIIPLATPGIFRRVPGWLLDPRGPLSIPPAYAVRIAPWLMRFVRSSMPDRYPAARDAQARLMDLSREALERLVYEADAEGLLRRQGQLQLYEGQVRFDAARAGWEERAAAGIRFEMLRSPDQISAIQPGIAPRFSHAVFTPDWLNVTDPKDWVEHLAEDGRRRGVVFEIAQVRGLRPVEHGVEIVTGDRAETFDKAVIAAGVHSRGLLAPLGLDLPLETERGYNTTLPPGAFDLRTHLTFADHGFVVTRVGAGVRVGGAVELGGLHLPPNMKRADALLRKAATFLPGLKTMDGARWMGFRPSMPDSLPVIGLFPGASDIILAFGHGHLGLTQSAGTAELVAGLVSGHRPPIGIAPYRAERFLRGSA